MEEEEISLINETFEVNCTGRLNELCMSTEDYEAYRSFVSVDTFEMVLISLNIIVFLAGIMGNLLVSTLKLVKYEIIDLIQISN